MRKINLLALLLHLALAAAFVLSLFGAVIWSTRASAEDGRNWCSEWLDGWIVGRCYRNACPADMELEPIMCPYPKGNEDPFTRGLKEGLEARKESQNEH